MSSGELSTGSSVLGARDWYHVEHKSELCEHKSELCELKCELCELCA